jgi:hypothetical protein
MKLRHRDPVASPPSAVDEDARALALELAGMRPQQAIDPVALRLVLEAGEVAWRLVPRMWFRVQSQGEWGQAVPADVLVTDRRLLLRLGSGEVVSLWWGAAVGFSPDLAAAHVVLDFGDGSPRAVAGVGTPVIAVAGVASLYGIEALTSHPSLTRLRHATPQPE